MTPRDSSDNATDLPPTEAQLFARAIRDTPNPYLSRPLPRAANSPPTEAELFAAAIRGKPLPSSSKRSGPTEAQIFAAAILGKSLPISRDSSRPTEAQLWAAAIRGTSSPPASEPLPQNGKQLSSRESLRDISTLDEGNWDSAKHPRGGYSQNTGWFSPTDGQGGASTEPRQTSHGASANDASQTHVLTVGHKKPKQSNDLAAPGSASATAKPPESSQGTTPNPLSQATVNADGVEVAGAGPATTQSYKDKVQSALQVLDPKVARWWKSNSVKGEIRSRTAGLFRSKARSWVEGDTQPIVEVDRNFTAGEAAQAIIDEVKDGWFADSIGAYYKKYKFLRTGDIEEFRKWQQGATAEAARLASTLAEMYYNSVATLTPAGDLVVTLGDLVDNGPRWSQLISILPLVGHLPIGAVFIKLGKREITVAKAVLRKFELLTHEECTAILVAAARGKTDDEAAAIIAREVATLVGDRQIHHPISAVVHYALEKHKNLRGKYELRDRRFEALAKDYGSHKGYPRWHRDLDKEVADWIKGNRDATEETFEKWLRDRYDKEDLRIRFPKPF